MISHDSESVSNATRCLEPGCYSRPITYNATWGQMITLAQYSSSCQQSIQVSLTELTQLKITTHIIKAITFRLIVSECRWTSVAWLTHGGTIGIIFRNITGPVTIRACTPASVALMATAFNRRLLAIVMRLFHMIFRTKV